MLSCRQGRNKRRAVTRRRVIQRRSGTGTKLMCMKIASALKRHKALLARCITTMAVALPSKRSNYLIFLPVLSQCQSSSISSKHLTRKPVLQNISPRQCRSYSDMNWALPAQGPNINLGVKEGCNQSHALCVKVGTHQISSGWRTPRQRLTSATAGERFERPRKSTRHECDGIRNNLVIVFVHG